MLLTDFNFELPEGLIAQKPSAVRGCDKLMALKRATGETSDHKMSDLVNMVAPGSLMIFNNSRVRRARVFAQKATSEKPVEFIFLSPLTRGAALSEGESEKDASLGSLNESDKEKSIKAGFLSEKGSAKSLGDSPLCESDKEKSAGGKLLSEGEGEKSLGVLSLGEGDRIKSSKAGFLDEGREGKSLGAGFLNERGSVKSFGDNTLGEKGKEKSVSAFDWEVLVGGSKHQKVGHVYTFCDGRKALISEKRSDGVALLHFDCAISEEWFNIAGHVPLPPYIKRADNAEDSERYQTVYAKNIGSVACPTAGLHFTVETMEALKAKGVDVDFVTLHVGLGTFLPVRESVIEAHKMHSELYTISSTVAKKINDAKASGRPIIAVGTTVMRTLEAAAVSENLKSGEVVSAGTRATNIFIYPPYDFKVVDALFTNFHTPQSTLLMLVSAFAGRKNILNAYSEAVKKEYRFFSYGDAMFIY